MVKVNKDKDYYQILGVEPSSSSEEIKKAYYKLAANYHPDKPYGDAEKFKEINEAYEILSDPKKRKEYNQQLINLENQKKELREDTNIEEVSKFELYLFSIIRVVLVILGMAFFFFILKFILWYYSDSDKFILNIFIPSIILGGLSGFVLGVDLNYDINSFLGPNLWGKIYSFIRTIILSLSGSYLGGLLGSALDRFYYKEVYLYTYLGFLLGALIGAVFGSDGESILKIKSKAGRFNLFYTSLRGILVGIICGLVTFISSLIIKNLTGINFLKPALISGLFLGIILGCNNPGNLAAYSAYVSSWLKNIIIVILLIVALILGTVIGFLLKINF